MWKSSLWLIQGRNFQRDYSSCLSLEASLAFWLYLEATRPAYSLIRIFRQMKVSRRLHYFHFLVSNPAQLSLSL